MDQQLDPEAAQPLIQSMQKHAALRDENWKQRFEEVVTKLSELKELMGIKKHHPISADENSHLGCNEAYQLQEELEHAVEAHPIDDATRIMQRLLSFLSEEIEALRNEFAVAIRMWKNFERI